MEDLSRQSQHPASAFISAISRGSRVIDFASEVEKHGKSGLKDILLGGVTKQVMRYADCEVLAVG